MNRARRSESGNVLWFILIALVLIGILTAMLSRSGTSVDQSGNIEQNRILAGQILRTSKAFESTIQNMKLNGISEGDLSFENRFVAGYTNTNCTSNECRIFHVEGGGLSYTNPPSNALDAANIDWIFTGENNVGTSANPVGSHGAGSGNDLLIMLSNVREGVCIEINKLTGLNAPNYTPPVDATGISTTNFTNTSTYQSATLVELDGDPTPFEMDGRSAGCFYDTPSDTNYFYQVIVER